MAFRKKKKAKYVYKCNLGPCLTCGVKEAWRLYKLTSRKCKEKNLLYKVKILFPKWYSKIFDTNPGRAICDRCVGAIDRFFIWVVKLYKVNEIDDIENSDVYVQEEVTKGVVEEEGDEEWEDDGDEEQEEEVQRRETGGASIEQVVNDPESSDVPCTNIHDDHAYSIKEAQVKLTSDIHKDIAVIAGLPETTKQVQTNATRSMAATSRTPTYRTPTTTTTTTRKRVMRPNECFVCFTTSSSKYTEVGGRLWHETDTTAKLYTLLGDRAEEVLMDITESACSICAKCHGLLVATSAWVGFFCTNAAKLKELRAETPGKGHLTSRKHQEELIKRLWHLQTHRKYTDVQLRVDDTVFDCHKVVMAASSPYFQNMFSGFSGSDDKILDLKNVNCRSFRVLIDYIYSGDLDLRLMAPDIVDDLLSLCDLVNMNGLKQLCEQYVAMKHDSKIRELAGSANTLPQGPDSTSPHVKTEVQGDFTSDVSHSGDVSVEYDTEIPAQQESQLLPFQPHSTNNSCVISNVAQQNVKPTLLLCVSNSSATNINGNTETPGQQQQKPMLLLCVNKSSDASVKENRMSIITSVHSDTLPEDTTKCSEEDNVIPMATSDTESASSIAAAEGTDDVEVPMANDECDVETEEISSEAPNDQGMEVTADTNTPEVDEEERNKRPHACPHCPRRFQYKSRLIRHVSCHTGYKPYVCKYCPKSFTNKRHQYIHELSHTRLKLTPFGGGHATNAQVTLVRDKTKPPACRYCGKKFENWASCSQHEWFHKSIKSYECPLCQKTFSSIEALVKHERTHKPPKQVETGPPTCSICNKTFRTRRNLTKHMATHGEKSFICSHCGMAFTSGTLLKIHERKRHGEGEARPYACTMCSKTFTHKWILDRHVVWHSKVEVRPYNCSKCSRTFKEEWYLDRHMQWHESHPGLESRKEKEKEKSLLCTVCGRNFLNKISLLSHERTHLIEQNVDLFRCKFCSRPHMNERSRDKHEQIHLRSYNCNHCDKQFPSKHKLARHEVVHTRENPVMSTKWYSCPFCEEKFPTESDTVVHMHYHHPGQYPYPCRFCPKGFYDKKSYLMHEKGVHKATDHAISAEVEAEQAANQVEVSFRCNLCPETFSQRSDLDQHKLTYHNKKPCPCNICGKIFWSKSDLKYHQYKHFGEKPHGCTLCDKRYVRKSELEVHMRRAHTKEKPYSCRMCSKTFFDVGDRAKHEKTVQHSKITEQQEQTDHIDNGNHGDSALGHSSNHDVNQPAEEMVTLAIVQQANNFKVVHMPGGQTQSNVVRYIIP